MKHLFKLIRNLIIFIFLMCAIIVIGVLYYMEYDLPNIDALNTVQLQVPLQIFTTDENELLTLWLADKILDVIENESELADQALKVAIENKSK